MGGFEGSVFYMAPEVIASQWKSFDFKADIWSLGCIVQEMSTGVRPWMGAEAVAVVFKVWNHRALNSTSFIDFPLSNLRRNKRRLSRMTPRSCRKTRRISSGMFVWRCKY
jgi:serine/threonine protein kinase